MSRSNPPRSDPRMIAAWLVPIIIFYAFSTAGFVLGRIGVRGQWTSYGTAMLGAGAVFQTFDLAIRGLEAGNVPVTNFAQSLSFLAWLIALAGLALIVRFRMAVIGTVVAPVVFVLLVAVAAMTRQGRLAMPTSLRSAWLPVHVTLAFFGDALFVLAAGVSLVYLVYESRLKPSVHWGRPMSAPPASRSSTASI